MFLKKVLNQPNIVGTVMIALLLGAGFVYAFAFDGFNVETVPGSEVDALLAQEGGGNYGGYDPDPCDCMSAYMTYDGCSSDVCESDEDCDGKASCSDDCAQKDNGGCSTCAIHPGFEEDSLHCENEGDLCGDNPEACQPANDPMDDDYRFGNS